jgi:hypothetical protein
VASASAICRRVITCAAASHIFADDNAAAGSQAPGRPTCTHSHSYEYRQAGTQKYSESPDGGHSTFASFDRLAIRFSHNTPQDISGVFCENHLSSRSKLPRPPLKRSSERIGLEAVGAVCGSGARPVLGVF